MVDSLFSIKFAVIKTIVRFDKLKLNGRKSFSKLVRLNFSQFVQFSVSVAVMNTINVVEVANTDNMFSSNFFAEELIVSVLLSIKNDNLASMFIVK